MKRIYLLSLVFLLLNLKTSLMSEIFILYKIDNEIITNVDIQKEAQYLIALNNQLKNLGKERIEIIAKESLIREKIKKNELSKFFKLNQENPYLDEIIKNFYLKLNLNSPDEFQNYLDSYGLTVQEIKEKMEVENLWNQMIYDRFRNQVVINEEKLKVKISKEEKLNMQTSYLLSEILFEKEKDKKIDETIKDINKSIEQVGFENSANIFSISDTSKFGGKIGWVMKKNLSEIIYNKISSLDIGSHTQPMQIGGNFLIIKILNIKNEKVKIDKESELKKMIIFERNRQLEKLSKIYFNKVKINTNVEKL